MKLFLIDGHALVFKMYYAFLGRPMVNSKGDDTSIIFGFTKYLLELIHREQPTHIAVAFDPPGGTFRNRMYPEYKANRSETPQLVIDSLEPLTKIVRALDIPVLMVPDFEADDVIGSAAKHFASPQLDVYMVTPDKDYGQLVDSHIFQYKPGKAGSDNEVLGVQQICQKYSISKPSQVIDILALCGDTADNVPGVQGVGPVGAAKLLSRYESLENIYEHIAELSARQQQMFLDARPHMALSKELVTIKTDMELAVNLDELKISTELGSEIVSLISYYEMPSLLKMLHSQWKVQDSEQKSIEKAPFCSLEYEQTDLAQMLDLIRGKASMSFCLDGNMLSVAVDNRVCSSDLKDFSSLLEDESIEKRAHGIKAQMKGLAEQGVVLKGRLLDVELLHYVLNPEKKHSLESITRECLNVDLEEESTVSSLSLFDEDGEANSSSPHFKAAVALYSLAPMLYESLGEMQKLYDSIEEPLMWVLDQMERTGVLIDLSSLRDFIESLRRRMSQCEAYIRAVAENPELNVASPKQIGDLLFDKLKLDPKAKKTGRGAWPTDEETLSALSSRHPVIEQILDYRGTRKLLSTYIEPIPSFISEKDGRVHTTFNQALTATGRLSSSNPNLQNIPIRSDEGREIRKAFTAAPGSVIMSADYSQIELRIMAHCCGDEHMIEAFKGGLDVHKAMAAKIFHKSLEEVSADDRRKAKTANFGIMYGISAFGLAQRLKISRSEAASLIQDYFASFPSIRSFLDQTLKDAREKAYVQTLFGRRRYVPDVNSANGNVRAIAERNAINAPIQGSAADIIKLAMIGVQRELEHRGLGARMILQVHDELVLEVPQNEIEEVKELLVRQMEGVCELAVPLTVECNYGKNWLEAH